MAHNVGVKRLLTAIVLACGLLCAAGAQSFGFWVGLAPQDVTREAIGILGRNGIRAGCSDQVNRGPVLGVEKEQDQLRAIAILSRMEALRKRGLVLFRRKYDPATKRTVWVLEPSMPADPGTR